MDDAAEKREDRAMLIARRLTSEAVLGRMPAIKPDVRWIDGPCGDGSRPYIWPDPSPRVGHPYGADFVFTVLPVANRQYDLPPTWVLVSLGEVLAEGHVMPGGCKLWLDPDSSNVLVWEFKGKNAFMDPIARREPGSKNIRFQLDALHPSSLGKTLYAQMVVLRGSEMWTSQTLKITIGNE